MAHVVYFQDKSGISLLASFDKGVGVDEEQVRLQAEKVAADRFDHGGGAVRYQDFGEDYTSAVAAKDEFDARHGAGARPAVDSGVADDGTVRRMDWSELGFTPIPGEADGDVVALATASANAAAMPAAIYAAQAAAAAPPAAQAPP